LVGWWVMRGGGRWVGGWGGGEVGKEVGRVMREMREMGR